jgi:hypothetical protein
MVLWALPCQVSSSLPVSATEYSLYMVNGESTYKRASLGKELWNVRDEILQFCFCQYLHVGGEGTLTFGISWKRARPSQD